MLTLASVAELRHWTRRWRNDELRIALVPTMGNLHQGHLALIKEAHKHADRVVCSIFVNPMQFGADEDFDLYPRTLEKDKQALKAEECHLLFTPETSTIYPEGLEQSTRVVVSGLSEILCGVHRAGHFAGVTTVISKLFNMVQPDLAFFGKKDFQQFLLIKRLTADLSIPIEILGVETVREKSGLALSSRNSYLDDMEKAQAAKLYQELNRVGDEIKTGMKNYRFLEQAAIQRLLDAGFVVDYFHIGSGDNLETAEQHHRHLVLLVAARLGKTRLIDNIEITI